MTRQARRLLWPTRLAVGFNAAAMAGCAIMIAFAPDRAGTLLAAAGLVFFALATAGFSLMLHLASRRRSAPFRGQR